MPCINILVKTWWVWACTLFFSSRLSCWSLRSAAIIYHIYLFIDVGYPLTCPQLSWVLKKKATSTLRTKTNVHVCCNQFERINRISTFFSINLIVKIIKRRNFNRVKDLMQTPKHFHVSSRKKLDNTMYSLKSPAVNTKRDQWSLRS